MIRKLTVLAAVLGLTLNSYAQEAPATAVATPVPEARPAAVPPAVEIQPATNVPPQPAPPAEPPVNPAWKHELQITIVDDGQWGCPLDNAHAVMMSAASELWKYFPDRKMQPIEVGSQGGPFFRYNIGADQRARIYLAYSGMYWDRLTYQFTHEFCHLLCNFEWGQSRQLWFQESLCETASRFALQRMSETWKTNPPYWNWKDYSGSLWNYFNNYQSNNRIPKDKTLGQWYRENAASCTYITPQVSAEMYDLLNAEPEHWEAMIWYPREKIEPDTFEQFLWIWRERVPERHKAFITKIAQMFEYDLDKPPAPPPQPAAATNAPVPAEAATP